MTSTQSSQSSVALPLPNDYGLELECANVLERQLEAARQHAYESQDLINMLRLEVAGVLKIRSLSTPYLCTDSSSHT